jgi:hypothetical protein
VKAGNRHGRNTYLRMYCTLKQAEPVLECWFRQNIRDKYAFGSIRDLLWYTHVFLDETPK